MRDRDRAPEMRREPDRRAAWLRVGAAEKIAAGTDANASADDVLNCAEVLLHAASCSTCVFRANDGSCRAWPPRPLQDGRPVWPLVGNDDWCGLWGAP